ncbi:MAG: hypothetical protein ABI639_08490 [Thermoanaerobaculia bacterium]
MNSAKRLAAAGTLFFALAAGVHAGVAPSVSSCSNGPTPSATLLLPYFEVDLLGQDHQTTLFAVVNAGNHPTLAHVVLWTDWGVPTLAFDIYLGVNDTQTMNLRDILNGVLPVTGGTPLNGCTNPVTLPALDATALTNLRKQHTGQANGSGNCSGSGRGGVNLATGYMTVDAAQACSATIVYPLQAGYFVAGGNGIASNENVLLGDFFFVDAAQNYAEGNEAIHIAADAARFGGSPSTFYGTWIGRSGDDARAPLGTKYRARYLTGGGFSGGTNLVVWAEPSVPTPEAVTCGHRNEFVDPCQYLRTQAFSEDAVASAQVQSNVVPQVASRMSVGVGADIPVTAPFGFVDFENRVQPFCLAEPTGDFPLQSLVIPLHSAAGRYAVGFNAFRIADDLCEPPVAATAD